MILVEILNYEYECILSVLSTIFSLLELDISRCHRSGGSYYLSILSCCIPWPCKTRSNVEHQSTHKYRLKKCFRIFLLSSIGPLN
jgi:hypothetical protein